MNLVLVAPKSDYTSPITQAKYTSIVMALIVMLILCVVHIGIFNRRVGNPIGYLMEEAGQIVDGNLTGHVKVAANDEMGALGGSLNHMIENLRKVISHVTDMSQQVAAASEQLTASADQSAQASHMVADSVVTIAEGASEQAIEAGRDVWAVSFLRYGFLFALWRLINHRFPVAALFVLPICSLWWGFLRRRFRSSFV